MAVAAILDTDSEEGNPEMSITEKRYTDSMTKRETEYVGKHRAE